MFQAVKGPKKIKYVSGDHNEPREDEFYVEMADYLVSLELKHNPQLGHQLSIESQNTQDILANWSDDESVKSDDGVQSAE